MKNMEMRALFDNTNQIKKIFYRFRSHGTFFLKALGKGIPLGELLLARFPYAFPDAALPPSMHVEVTNACNLNCQYCNNHLFPHPRILMNEKLFNILLDNLEQFKVNRVCLGGGEPTIHPDFVSYLDRIRARTRILTTVSNGQWRDDDIGRALVRNNVDLIEISVDLGGKEVYESSRIGASYELLKSNLKKLKSYKVEYGSKSQINIRLMVRPSTEPLLVAERSYWLDFADTVMPQYLMKDVEVAYATDLYYAKNVRPAPYPRCTLPFKSLQVRADGSVFLCQVSGSSVVESKKLLLGNLETSNIRELWNHPFLKQYREAHRSRRLSAMPICRGCMGL